jgi:hypothetical protein
MSRARDDRRRNNRRDFALYRADGSRVGEVWTWEADGCGEGCIEGKPFAYDHSEWHVPGSHVLIGGAA